MVIFGSILANFNEIYLRNLLIFNLDSTQAGIWDESFFDIIKKERQRANIISKDDILDALACMWSAYRCLHGIEQIIVKDEEFYDDEGLLMRYTF